MYVFYVPDTDELQNGHIMFCMLKELTGFIV